MKIFWKKKLALYIQFLKDKVLCILLKSVFCIKPFMLTHFCLVLKTNEPCYLLRLNM